MEKFKTYVINGGIAYASGEKMHYPKNSTVCALKNIGVNQIVWQNQAFEKIATSQKASAIFAHSKLPAARFVQYYYNKVKDLSNSDIDNLLIAKSILKNKQLNVDIKQDFVTKKGNVIKKEILQLANKLF